MYHKHKENLWLLLVPIVLSFVLIVQLIDSFFLSRYYQKDFFFNSAWSYLETSLFALVLSLCNSLPYIIKVIRLRNTSSFALYTLSTKTASGFCTLFNITSSCILEAILFYSSTNWWMCSYIYSNGVGVSYQSSLWIMWIRWITDILGNIVSWTTAIIALIFKIKLRKNKNENYQPEWKKPKFMVMFSILFVLSSLAFIIAIFYKLNGFDISKYQNETYKYLYDTNNDGIIDYISNKKKPDIGVLIDTVCTKNVPQFRLFLFFLTTAGTCISAYSAAPTIIKLIMTRNTYSISLFSKVSLLSSMFVWTILDIQTASGFNQFIPVIVGDFFTIFWTSIYIYVKSSNLIQAKKKGISEKELIDLFNNKKAAI
ncbi:MAG: hypothetical protein LBB39_02680 [Mycoplasmataceae bacterium]|jgi:hypothetical protein|nr:hypothetical protein [Mycoplasmataceae bacterium]